jgi:hypothetical protein
MTDELLYRRDYVTYNKGTAWEETEFDYVEVKRCEHGNIDRHRIPREALVSGEPVVSAYWCEGAELENEPCQHRNTQGDIRFPMDAVCLDCGAKQYE